MQCVIGFNPRIRRIKATRLVYFLPHVQRTATHRTAAASVPSIVRIGYYDLGGDGRERAGGGG